MSQKSRTSKKYPQYGAVILLDSLGTKGIWKNRNPKEVTDRWNGLVNNIKNRFSKYEKEFGVFPSIYTISDTMIITILGSDADVILRLAGVVSGAAVEIGIIFKIYLRGCISIGKIFQYNNMILGPAIDEASQYYEKSNWIGVFATSSAYSALTRLSTQSGTKSISQYVEWGVPTKNGILNTWAVYLSNKLQEDIQKNTGVKTLIEVIHNQMEYAEDSEGLEKWKNTLDFMRCIYLKKENKSQWLNK